MTATRTRWPYWGAVAVGVLGALVTAGLVVLTALLNHSNDRHLLRLRTREVGATLTAALPEIETPLGAAVALADATRGDPKKFRRLVAPDVGGGGRPFVSFSLWRTRHLTAGPAAYAGLPPLLHGRTAVRFLRQAARSPSLSVIGVFNRTQPRIGYAYSGATNGPFVAYGAAALPAKRITRVPPNSAYSDLDFAIYLGRSTRRSALLLADVRHLPLAGPTSRLAVPFGNTELTVVVAARQPLAGVLPQRVPLGLAIGGALLTLLGVAVTVRLIRGRGHAEALAAENRRLYDEQRTISLTIQQALLPDSLPDVPGMELAARYQAGERDVEVGGDWYDLISPEPGRLLLIVGDVSGRGLRAATAMASLRFAIHYAALEASPEEFLPKLSALRRLRAGGQLATVVCADMDLDRRQVSVTSAGHLPLLMIAAGDASYLESEVGLPLGVDEHARYRSRRYDLPPGAALVAFTDGLVERRGEVLDAGLERLRKAAVGLSGSLDGMMDELIAAVRAPTSPDDTALAGVRWR